MKKTIIILAGGESFNRNMSYSDINETIGFAPVNRKGYVLWNI